MKKERYLVCMNQTFLKIVEERKEALKKHLPKWKFWAYGKHSNLSVEHEWVAEGLVENLDGFTRA